jgi:hypothetical protein
LFSTPFTNLKFKLDFSQKLEKSYEGNALLIKDTSQIEDLKINNPSRKQTNPPSPYQITFKVVKQYKEGYGSKNGKKLTYSESFSKHGEYKHILEIEPLDLGIEDLPPITQLTFSFFNETNPLAEGNLELAKRELYKAKTLENSVGKTFSLKTQMISHDTKRNLDFFTN